MTCNKMVLVGMALLASSSALAGGHIGNAPAAVVVNGSGSGNFESILATVDLREIEAFLTKDGERITPEQIRRFYLKDELDAPVLSNLEALKTWQGREIPIQGFKKLEIRLPLNK